MARVAANRCAAVAAFNDFGSQKVSFEGRAQWSLADAERDGGEREETCADRQEWRSASGRASMIAWVDAYPTKKEERTKPLTPLLQPYSPLMGRMASAMFARSA